MAEIYNEMLIRNVDCGLLYFQIKDDEAIREYEDLKKEKNAPMKKEMPKQIIVSFTERKHPTDANSFISPAPRQLTIKSGYSSMTGTVMDISAIISPSVPSRHTE